MQRLRYTGDRAVTFQTGNVGHTEPGGEFDVPDEVAPRFLRRPDIERAGGGGTPPGEDVDRDPGTGDAASGAAGEGTGADGARAGSGDDASTPGTGFLAAHGDAGTAS